MRHIRQSGSGMQAAFRRTLRMCSFLIGLAGLPAHEAGMLLSLAGDLRICQAVDPNKTCCLELPLSVLRSCGYVFP